MALLAQARVGLALPELLAKAGQRPWLRPPFELSEVFFCIFAEFFAFFGRIVANNARLLENQLKTQRATAQIHGAAKPVCQSEVHGATTAATRQVVVDPRGATGLDLRAHAVSTGHAAQNVVRAARTMVVLAPQAVGGCSANIKWCKAPCEQTTTSRCCL